MRKNHEIERLRGIAILLVIVAHTSSISTALPAVLQYSWVGVDLFFVISGYVVILSLLRLLPSVGGQLFSERLKRAKPSLRIFYIRRVYRILPLVFFWMGTNLLLAYVFRNDPVNRFGTPAKIATENLYFLTGFFNYLRDNTAIQGQLWSLSVEEHFYFLVPLLFVFAESNRARKAVAVGGIIAVVLFLRPLIPVPVGADPTSFLAYSSHRRFDQLFFGVLLALSGLGLVPAAQARSTRQASTSPAFAKSLIAGLLVAALWITPGLLAEDNRFGFGITIYGLISLALVSLASLEKGYIFGQGLLGDALEYVGSRSYSLYLCHVPLRRIQMYFTGIVGPRYNEILENSFPLRLLDVCIALTLYLVVAELTFRWIEKPFIQRGRRRTSLPDPESLLVKNPIPAAVNV